MIKRPPAMPHMGLMSGISLVLALFAGLAAGMWSELHQPNTAAYTAQLVWLGLTIVAYGGFLLVVPLLRALRVTAPTGRPTLGHWLVFYGLFLGASLVGCALRAWLARLLLGPAAPPLTNWVLHFNPVCWMMLLLLFFEGEAAFRQACALEEAQLGQEIEQLFLSREMVLRTLARGTYEVLALLAEHVEPSLEALHAELAELRDRALAGELLADARLAALQDDLDTLGDERIRQLSHLLHPSIIQLGLLPALKSLARHYEPHVAVQVEADAPFLQADDMMQSRLPAPLQLSAYRVVEAALDNVVRHARAQRVTIQLTWAEVAGLGLKVADDGAGYDPATAPRGLGHELIDSRVSLLGGQWHIESAPGAGTQLTASLPVPGRAGPA